LDQGLIVNELTEPQVSAAFDTAGLTPVATTAAIATALSAQLRITAPAFASIPFGVEPGTLHVTLVKEKN
jgi:hypothetical protein